VPAVSPANLKTVQPARLPLQLQALERFLGQRFRFLDLGIFVIRPADADRNESIAFQDIKYAAKAIARPEGFFADAFDLFRWNWFLFFFFAAHPGSFSSLSKRPNVSSQKSFGLCLAW
jgi:hypothetical protein